MFVTDIQKAGGVLIQNRCFLVTKSFGKDIFVAPGGKLEKDESAIQALERELTEELNIKINASTIEALGTFYAEAAGQGNLTLEMQVFYINDYAGEMTPSSEIEEIKWINTQTHDVKIGSVFEHDVMPLLKQQDLID
jgi:8-oxo-dGTP pyrophosphatase MutT (NUDIX family)